MKSRLSSNSPRDAQNDRQYRDIGLKGRRLYISKGINREMPRKLLSLSPTDVTRADRSRSHTIRIVESIYTTSLGPAPASLVTQDYHLAD